MKILFSPQINDDHKIKYTFHRDKITVMYKGISEDFDFSGMPDGRVERPHDDIDTNLSVNVIISSERVNGELRVILLNYISENATVEERFPEWFKVELDG